MVQILPEDQCRARQRNNDRYILSLELTNINFVGCPARLSELEKHADMAAKYMALTSKKPNIQQDAMNRLRQLFNLEFKMLCDVCGPDHYQDEISAPER